MKTSKNNDNHGGKILDSVNGFDVVECDQCQFKRITQLRTE